MATTPRIGFFVKQHYLKDLSFENPTGPISVEEAQALRVGVAGNVLSRPLAEKNQFRVETTLTVTGRDEQQVRFISELTYAADVMLSNIPAPVQEQTLCVDVPDFLIQHINAVIDHAARAGGLPALRVENINFLALYKQGRARRAAGTT